MEKRDEKIKEYLTSYAEEIKPDKNSALSLARAEMEREWLQRATLKSKKANAKQGKKFNFKKWLVPLSAALSGCLVFALIISVVIGNMFTHSQPPTGDGSMSPQIYNAGQLSVSSTSREQLSGLGITLAYADGAVIEQYKLYKLKDTARPILVESKYRFINENGIYEDVTLYAELDVGYRYVGNMGYERLPKYGDSLLGVRAESGYLDGEYFTKAYLKQEYEYFLNVYSPEHFYTQKYLELFFKIGTNASPQLL